MARVQPPTSLPLTTSLRRTLLIVSLGLLSVGAARAASIAQERGTLTDLPFEQLLSLHVFSASKFEQNLSEAPSVASVITADEIKTFGWRTLADVLASVRGLYVTSDRNYQYLGARGFLRPGDYNGRFLLLVDGYRLNDSIYDQAPIGTDFVLDMELIDRIEYVPGPGSSVYGSNAFFGVINVISKSGTLTLGARGSVEAGSFGARRAQASYGWKSSGNARMLISASDYRIKGQDHYYREFDSASTNFGVARRLDHDRARNVLMKLEAGGLTLAATHAQRDKGIPTASYQQAFNDPRSRTVDTQSSLRLDYQMAVDHFTDLSWRAFVGRHDYVGTYAYDAPPVTIEKDGGRARWWGGEFKVVSSAVTGHKLVAGVEYTHDVQRDQYNYRVDPFETNLDDRRHGRRAGIYVQDEITPRHDLLLNAGLRYDRLPGVVSHFSPRLAIIYKAAPQTTVKAIAGSAYRAPNAYELYYEVLANGGQKANTSLKSEYIRSVELALEHHFSADGRVTISTFRNVVANLISQSLDADGLLVFRNLDRVSAHGVELGYEKIWSTTTRLRTSYSWQQSKDARTGLAPVNSPRHLAKINLSKDLAPELRAGIEAQYTSARATLADRTSSFWLANGTLTYALSRQADLSAGIYNLFDRRYADPASGAHVQDRIEQDGRSTRIRLAYRF